MIGARVSGAEASVKIQGLAVEVGSIQVENKKKEIKKGLDFR